MKKLFLLGLFFSLCLTYSIAQSGPIMKFDSDEVAYGDIEQNSEPLRVWKFTNVGDEPLVIQNAKGSCGCTVPAWPKEPIMPGESGQIEIRYDTKRIGPINKIVTLTTNEKSGEARKLKVTGTIKKTEDTSSVPVNQGRMF